MAKDNDKGKKAKSASKKGKKQQRDWKKMIIPLFLVVTMLGTVVAYVASSNWSSRIGNNEQSSSTTRAFGGIQDGLSLIPQGAGFARYADLKNDSVLSNAVDSYIWLKGSLPSSQIFGVSPKRDLFAIYPAGHFGSFSDQFVSLTDFGTSKINTSYPDYYDINGVIAKQVNSMYYYTPSTVPVVSGRIENVAPVINVMFGSNASAYKNYSDLFDELKYKQISNGGMTFETVGTTSNLTYSDRYYAAIGPVDPSNTSAYRLYSYVAILHTNTTIPDADLQNLALLQGAMEKMGFQSYNTQVYDDYIVIEAKGSLSLCLDDMYSRWGFIKYQAAL
ncbi:MAG TPA: hypothetical protein VMC84_11285 [Methanocella sp.]|uniref:hypothetical protein n=1 Tax=Methanocella sp. TaxID=2052833 RepID=UPI002B525B51|nr:hypothetical protein [Methanocella sp.]HTY91749.1 hypothetical protein [Methanocella sp.]